MKKILFFVVLLLSYTSLTAQNDNDYYAIFLYNFTRQIAWPDAYSAGNIKISVIDSPELVTKINKFSENNPVGSQSVVATESKFPDIERCHIIFLPSSESALFDAVMAKFKGTSTVIITDNPELLNKGADISFVKEKSDEGEGDIIKYRYNKNTLQHKNLRISVDFLTLGRPN